MILPVDVVTHLYGVYICLGIKDKDKKIIFYRETGQNKTCWSICRNSLHNFKSTFILKSSQLKII